MYLSHYFIPTLKETPAEAEIASHRLMLRAGLVRAEARGIYTWLPLGLKVLRKIEQIIREEQNKAGALEILMPTLQPADLWKESGRYDAYGKEMLRIQDRHERDLLYSPTNEEMVTDIFRNYVKSYKDLPKMFYQIHWKFRDEIRPRFGVMRGREFLMKDNYSFDIDLESAKRTYNLMYTTYLKTFKRLGLKAIPVKADPGPIGGDMSHEFCIFAETGETTLYYDPIFTKSDINLEDINPDDLKAHYAATDEMHDPKDCPVDVNSLEVAKGIEVGHIFYFGTKYSDAFKAMVSTADMGDKAVHMGSYGIGVSRLVGAIIEGNHDENGIIWPEPITPFDIGIVNLRQDDAKCHQLCEDLYRQLTQQNFDVLYDDRDQRAGVKLSDIDLIGLPCQIIVGPKGLEKGVVELKIRKTGERQELSVESLMSTLIQRNKQCA